MAQYAKQKFDHFSRLCMLNSVLGVAFDVSQADLMLSGKSRVEALWVCGLECTSATTSCTTRSHRDSHSHSQSTPRHITSHHAVRPTDHSTQHQGTHISPHAVPINKNFFHTFVCEPRQCDACVVPACNLSTPLFPFACASTTRSWE